MERWELPLNERIRLAQANRLYTYLRLRIPFTLLEWLCR